MKAPLMITNNAFNSHGFNNFILKFVATKPSKETPNYPLAGAQRATRSRLTNYLGNSLGLINLDGFIGISFITFKHQTIKEMFVWRGICLLP